MSVERKVRGLTSRIPLIGPRLAKRSFSVIALAILGYKAVQVGAIYAGYSLFNSSPPAVEQANTQGSKENSLNGAVDPEFSGVGEITLVDGTPVNVAYDCNGPLVRDTSGHKLSLSCTLTPPTPAELGQSFELEARISGSGSIILVRPNCSMGNPYWPDRYDIDGRSLACNLANLALGEYEAQRSPEEAKNGMK